MELSDEQVHVLLAMRRLYLQNMGALERRREELAAMVVPVRAPVPQMFCSKQCAVQRVSWSG